MSNCDCREVRNEKDLRKVFSLRYKAYCLEQGWLNPDNYPANEEEDSYDKYSAHLLATVDNHAVGTMRLILGAKSPQGLPIQTHPNLENIELDLADSAEISRLTLLVGYRKREVGLCLYRLMYQFSKSANLKRWYIVSEENVIRSMRMIGFKFIPLSDPGFYLGSDCIPAYLDIDEVEKHLKYTNNELYQWFQKKDALYNNDRISCANVKLNRA